MNRKLYNERSNGIFFNNIYGIKIYAKKGLFQSMNTAAFIQFLLERFKIEHSKHDRSGIYGFTQRLMAYNSNKIEGSTLTEEQTAPSLILESPKI